MIDLPLTGAQLRLERDIQEWAAREVAPKVHDFVHTPSAARAVVLEALRRFVQAGADYVALGMVCEELEYADTSIRVLLSEHSVSAATGEFAIQLRRFTAAAGATGLIRASRDASIKYTSERPALAHANQLIAGMESDYQVSRSLWLRAATAKNGGQRSATETDLACSFAIAAAERAAADAVRVHGANGYSNAYPVGRIYRNCRSSREPVALQLTAIQPIGMRPPFNLQSEIRNLRWNQTSH